MNKVFQVEKQHISINLNQSNNCCLESLKVKIIIFYKIAINYLFSPFYYAIISGYTNTQKSYYYVLQLFQLLQPN